MAKIRKNIIIQGLSGSIGDQLVIRQDKAGRTIIGVPPTTDPNRVFTQPELERQQKFRDAVTYAKGAKDQAVYVEKADGTPMNPYNVAMADWFHAPEIKELDAEAWSGAVGQVIRIQAVDDIGVSQVNVVITDTEGAVLEQGAAVQAEGAWWNYTTTAMADDNARIVVTARDLPGNILKMDAILAYDANGKPIEPEWPAVNIIIGNPPFLGGGKIRAELGDRYVEDLFKLYEGRLPAFSDLVCYWFEKARAMIEEGKAKRVGLLATQGIRGGANRKVLERIKETGDIFWAQSDRNWILNGATVHVSMLGFDSGLEKDKRLDDKIVEEINPDLTSNINITTAELLTENKGICFMGPSAKAPFDIDANIAQQMLLNRGNPNGKPNSDVVRPVVSAVDIAQGSRGKWTIDFSLMELIEASGYEMPFEYVRKNVLPVRETRRDDYRGKWWQYARPRPEMRSALENKTRYIATPGVSKHRIFIWVNSNILCNQGTLVFARDDDYFFGILHSKLHELWARRTGTQLREAESGFRYTPTTTFETFPFPFSPGQEPKDDPRVGAIAQAAKELVEQRDRWLNSQQTSEVSRQDSKELKPRQKTSEVSVKRTLTNLYNARPTWLDLAHKRLDAAVFAAYGWKSDLSDEEILEKLLALNLERSKSDGL